MLEAGVVSPESLSSLTSRLHGLQSSFKFFSPYFHLIIRFILDFRVIGASYLFHCPLNLLMSLSIGNGSYPGPAVARRTFSCRHVSQSPCEAQNRARQCALVAFCQCETATLNLTRRFALPQSKLCPNTVLCVCYWHSPSFPARTLACYTALRTSHRLVLGCSRYFLSQPQSNQLGVTTSPLGRFSKFLRPYYSPLVFFLPLPFSQPTEYSPPKNTCAYLGASCVRI